MKIRLLVLLALVLLPLVSAAPFATRPTVADTLPLVSTVADSPVNHTEVTSALQSAPIMFIENAGQFDDSARFQVRGGDHTMWLAEDALWITVMEPPAKNQRHVDRLLNTGIPPVPDPQPEIENRKGVNIKLSFVGANPHPRLEPFNRLETHVSYFFGNNADQWHADVPVWGGVRYVDLYPGVSLEIAEEQGHLVQKLLARSMEDLKAVRLVLTGANVASIGSDDDLHFATSIGAVRANLPYAMVINESPQQKPAGVYANVEFVQTVISGNELTFSHRQFDRSSIDNSESLVSSLNSADLAYSTYLGGGANDCDYYRCAIALGLDHGAYIAGDTASSDFPNNSGVFTTTSSGGLDVFVTKLNALGTGVLYSAIIGGSGLDFANGIAVGQSGQAYIAGATHSIDFPVTAGAFDQSLAGSSDGFVVKLNASGNSLTYSTLLGGENYECDDWACAIVVDTAGAAYVTGLTGSADFPVTPSAYDQTYNGHDSFITKLDASGSSLVYSTFLGGASADGITDIAVDATGSVYVAGYTQSTDFPTTNGAFDRTYNGGGSDAFIAKLDTTGSVLAYSTFLGGDYDDEVQAIGVDGSGAAYVTGSTLSTFFPTTPGAFKTVRTGNPMYEAFVTKFNPSGSQLSYSTLLGGEGSAFIGYAFGIGVDAYGSATVTGITEQTDFPTTPGALDTTLSGGDDAYVTRFNPTGSGLLYSTYLGGDSFGEWGADVAVDVDGIAYVLGHTDSDNFPTTLGAFDRTYNGGGDIFVAKLAMGSTSGPVLTVAPGSVPANGTTSSTVTLFSASSGHQVRIISSRGSLDTFSTASGIVNSNGQFATTIRSTNPGVAIISAQDLTTGQTLPASTRVEFTGGSVPPPPSGKIAIVRISSDLPLNGLYPYLETSAAAASQFANEIGVTVDWRSSTPGHVAFVLNGQTVSVPANTAGARTTLNMATQAGPGTNTLRIIAYDSNGNASLPMSYSFSNYILGEWLLPAFEAGSSSASLNSVEPFQEPSLASTVNAVRLPKACTDPGNDDDTDQSFGVEINQANNGAPQIEASLRVPPTPLRSVMDLGLSGGTGLEKLQFYALVAIPLDGSNSYAATGGFDITTRTCDRRRVSPKLILWGMGPRGEGPIKGTKPWLNIKTSAELGASGQLYPVFSLDELDASAKVKLELEWRKSVLVLLKIHPALSPIYDAIAAVPGLESWLADHAAIILTLGPSFELSGAFSAEASGLTLKRADAGMGFDIQGRLEVHAVVDLTTYAGVGGNARLRYTPATRQIGINYARLYGEIGYRLTGPFGLNQSGSKTVEWVYDIDLMKWVTIGSALPGVEGQWHWSEHLPGKNYAVFNKLDAQRPFALGESDLQPANVAVQTTVTSLLVSNVYTYPEPSLAVNPVTNNALLLWVHDDIAKPVGQSQEIEYSRWNGSSWSVPTGVTNDNLLDGAPQVAWMSDGKAVAVWQRLNDTLPITATWDVTSAQKIEIATSVYSPTTGMWTPITLLTNNSALDMTPRLARSTNGQLLAAWRQNSAGLLGGTITDTDRILYALYDNGWGTPATATDNIPGLVDLAAGYGNNTAMIAYARYLTPTGYATPTLQLFTSVWNGVTWSAPQQLTDDSLGHRNSQVIYNTANQPLLVWLAGSELRLRNLATNATISLTLESGTGIDEFRVVQDAAGNIAAVFTAQNSQRDLFVAFFDQTHLLWGRPMPLTGDRASEAYPAAALDSAGRLLMGYAATTITPVTHTTTISSTGEVVTYTLPIEGQTDLLTLSHEFTRNLTLDSLTISVAHPVPGEQVVLSATVRNSGDLAIGSVTVGFYDGDPLGDGVLMGDISLPSPLAGGFTATLTTTYTVPITGGVARLLYAVADPAHVIAESNEADNIAVLRALGPDLEISSAGADYWGGSNVGLVALVRNIGTTDAPTATLAFYRDTLTGTLAVTDTLPLLAAGQALTLTTPWNFGILNAGAYPMAVVVNQSDFTETFTINNVLTFTLDAQPDLMVSPYYLWTSSPTGTTVLVTTTVYNVGAITVTNVVVGFYGDDRLNDGSPLLTRTIPVLASAGSTTLTGQVNGPLACTLYAYVDPGRAITETTRSNNLAGISYRGLCQRVYLPIVLRK